MIYIPECRLCGKGSLAPNCLERLQVCGNCWVSPPSHGFNLDYIGQQGVAS